MSLRPRLQMLAAMVRDGIRIADIGTDHAYLPAFLVRSGKCSGGIAADLRKSPLENAAETLRIYQVEDRVSLRLSDGLDCILPEECDDIVFAGLGGTLIVEILARTPWVRDAEKRLILQPMTHSEDVRRFLCENGFSILREDACRDDGRDYVAFCAAYTGETQDRGGLYHFLGAHPLPGNEASLRYAQKQMRRVYTRRDALKSIGVETEELQYLDTMIQEFEEKQPCRL